MQPLIRRNLPLISACVLAIMTMACGGTTTVVGGSTFTPIATLPSATLPPATATQAPATCATDIGAATAASGGPAFADMSFPVGSVNSPFVTVHQDPGRWAITLGNFCSPGTTVTAVRGFFASDLPTHSWVYSPTLPFDGAYQAPCGDAYCWAKDVAPRYLGLEAVTSDGHGNVTYKVREFVPPAPPVCDPMFGAPPYLHTGDGSVPLPPLTVNGGPGDGYSNGGHTYSYRIYCSAGTVASIQAFLATALPAAGFTTGGTIACVSGTGWVKGHERVTVNIISPTGWQAYVDTCA